MRSYMETARPKGHFWSVLIAGCRERLHSSVMAPRVLLGLLLLQDAGGGHGGTAGRSAGAPGAGRNQTAPEGALQLWSYPVPSTLLPLRPALGLHVTFKSLRNELCILFPQTVKKIHRRVAAWGRDRDSYLYHFQQNTLRNIK